MAGCARAAQQGACARNTALHCIGFRAEQKSPLTPKLPAKRQTAKTAEKHSGSERRQKGVRGGVKMRLEPFFSTANINSVEFLLAFRQVDYALDERYELHDDRRKTEREQASQNRDRQHDEAGLVVPEIELVHTQRTEKNSQQGSGHMIFRDERLVIRLAITRLIASLAVRLTICLPRLTVCPAGLIVRSFGRFTALRLTSVRRMRARRAIHALPIAVLRLALHIVGILLKRHRNPFVLRWQHNTQTCGITAHLPPFRHPNGLSATCSMIR